MKQVEPDVELWRITPDAEALIERAGRICYKSEELITRESAGKFIKMLIARGHESVIEHPSATMCFVCDRGVTHELVRHRIASYSQSSTRFCNYTRGKFDGQISVVRPPGLTDTQWWRRALVLADIEMLYKKEVKEGLKPQIARGLLPISLKTEIVVSANLREWRHIFNLRCSKAAHPQIRALMKKALVLLWQQCPNVFGDLKDEFIGSVEDCMLSS